MLVEQDSCRLNNAESFLYTFSCIFDIVGCIIVIGRGIPPNKHAIFLSLFLLQIFIEFIYKFLLMFYYNQVSK